MENNKGCRNKIFLFLGGTLFVAFLGVLGIMFDVIQIGQTGLIASQGNQANSTLIALQEEELYVQQRMLTAQSISGGLSTTEKGDGESPTSLPEYTSTIAIPTNTSIPTITIPTKQPVDLPFHDDFDLGARNEWQPVLGTWRMVDGKYTADLSNNWSVSLVGDESWTNYSIDVDVYSHNRRPVRIIVRSLGNHTYLAFETGSEMGSGGSNWILVIDGIATTIAHGEEGGLRGGTAGYMKTHLRVEVQGNIFSTFSDGVLILRVQDDALVRGKIGLALLDSIEQTTRFDNLRVELLP